jgi:hypothetical protein
MINVYRLVIPAGGGVSLLSEGARRGNGLSLYNALLQLGKGRPEPFEKTHKLTKIDNLHFENRSLLVQSLRSRAHLLSSIAEIGAVDTKKRTKQEVSPRVRCGEGLVPSVPKRGELKAE